MKREEVSVSIKHIRAVSFVAMAGAIVNVIWAVANIFFGSTFVVLENFAVAAGFLAAYFLNRLGNNFLAPILVSVMFLLHVSFATYFFGYGSGAYHFFLLGTVIPYLIFGRSEALIANALAAVSGLAYLACVIFQKSLLGQTVVGTIESMEVLNAFFLLAVLAATTAFFVATMRQGDDALEAEHARSEALLYNLLPEDIAKRLKAEPNKIIADSLPQVAILFADIVNFTPRSANLKPEEIVAFLNRIFSAFDKLAAKHGLEKIKTVGDAYMVAAGLPKRCEDPEHLAAEMALDMLRVVAELPDDVELRIGLHSGPAVAGVIGSQKLFYDVWGETVNIASRMESHGLAGQIQVTDTVRTKLSADYVFEPRGTVDIKGVGAVNTWLLKLGDKSG